MKRGSKRSSSERDGNVEAIKPRRAVGGVGSGGGSDLFCVTLSTRDRAPELLLSKDQLTVANVEGGYRMVRASHGVHNGSYFYEVEVIETKELNTHVRLGWSTRQGSLQAPCGFDKWSYGYRDIAGM
jgi:hypothetical protein